MPNDMSETLITIIVPIYKVEPYIRKCVESIIAQTHKRIEVFLVDDGTPDNCGAICDEYARIDNRITVIHKKNGGVSSARNVALDAATGEYLMYVDGDDWVEPDFCETALRIALENDAQVVSFAYNMVYADSNGTITGKKNKRVPSKTGFMEASEAVRHLILRDFVIYNFVWNKLFRRSIWDNVRFPEGRAWEDQAVTYMIIIKAGRVFVSDAVLYNYAQHHESIMGSMMNNPQTIIDRFTIWNERLSRIRQYSPENERFQLMQVTDSAITGFMYIRPDSEYSYILNEMGNFLSTNRNCLLHCDGKLKAKIKLWIYYYCRPLLFMIRYGREAKKLLIR